MDDLNRFFEAASQHGHGSADEVMRRVLHLDTDAVDHFGRLAQQATPEVLALFEDLDFELRARSPGLHYVLRAKYIGYRRETDAPTAAAGARSQVFLSVVPRDTMVKVLLPLPYTGYSDHPLVESVEERGHHGVGTIQCSLRDKADLATLLGTFERWLISS